jgi:hypothetical protein
MTLRLNGSTSGYVEIAAPAEAADNTLTLPSSGELVAATSGNIDVTSINSLNYPTAGALANRNLIINGGMGVWQRGTSQTLSGGYAADRFWMASASSAARSTDAPAGFTYSTKLTYSASDMAIGQPIELPATGQQGQLAAGITVTLSYYAKVDSGTEGIQTSIKFRDSKFSGTNEVAFTSSNPNATWTTTWTRYEHQFTVPTVAGTNILAGLEISGISKDAYITGVQLEAGSVATPFEHRSYGDELQRCMRYYEKSQPITYYYAFLIAGSVYRGAFRFTVPKRAAPDVVVATANTGSTFSTLPTVFGTNIDAFDYGASSACSFRDYTADAEF